MLYLYIKNEVGIAPILVKSSMATPPVDYTRVTDIDEASQQFGHGHFDYKTIRDCIRDIVIEEGQSDVVSIETNPATISPAPSVGDKYLIGAGAVGVWVDLDGLIAKWLGSDWQYMTTVESGFNGLSATDQETVAQNNIGTGQQIQDAIPNSKDRDNVSRLYLDKMKGTGAAVRPSRALLLEAATWSRMKALSVTIPPSGPTMESPAFIYALITINNPDPELGEMGGNLLELFAAAGIQGFYAGDKVLGIYDFIQETPGTRFDPANGGGLRSHPLLASLIPNGFIDMNDFADNLYMLLDCGFSPNLF